jgi:hypothetical protein
VRTGSTPHATRFARLGLGAFYGAVGSVIFYDFIIERAENFDTPYQEAFFRKHDDAFGRTL